MTRVLSAAYALVMGVSMLGMWAMFLATGRVPELATRPIEIAFHLAAEGLTAAMLIAAGIAVVARASWARATWFLAVGMLEYTLIVSPGYFAQHGQPALVAMFGAFLLAGLVLVAANLRAPATG
jgi:hypothetical protein